MAHTIEAKHREKLLGKHLQHHNIPNARPDSSKRAASAEPMGVHRKEFRAYDLAALETQNMDERIRNRDKVLADKHTLLWDIYHLTTTARNNPSFPGLLQLVDDVRDRLRPALLIGHPPNAPQPGPFTLQSETPQDRHRQFNDGVPLLEPGNQCVSPETDEPLFEGVLHRLQTNAAERRAHIAQDRGELFTEYNQYRIWKRDRGWDVAKHGLMNWGAIGTKADFPTDLRSPERPTSATWSPITPLAAVPPPDPTAPPFSPITPRRGRSPVDENYDETSSRDDDGYSSASSELSWLSRTPSLPSSPSPAPPPVRPQAAATNGPTGSRLPVGPKGRKRKAVDEHLPPRTKYARGAKDGEKRYH